MDDAPKPSIVIFDGICNCCNASINWIIRHDKKNKFRFTPLQSEAGKKLLLQYAIDSKIVDSIILLENDKVYIKSTAILKISKQLNGIYPLLYSLIAIPAFIRNSVYDIIAKNRYRWFGKKDTCMIPSEEIKSKFINET